MLDTPPSENDFLQTWIWPSQGEGPMRQNIGEVRHVFTHRDLRQKVMAIHGDPNVLGQPVEGRWVFESDLSEIALSRLTQKVLELAAGAGH